MRNASVDAKVDFLFCELDFLIFFRISRNVDRDIKEVVANCFDKFGGIFEAFFVNCAITANDDKLANPEFIKVRNGLQKLDFRLFGAGYMQCDFGN